jgi:hypothetical protein
LLEEIKDNLFFKSEALTRGYCSEREELKIAGKKIRGERVVVKIRSGFY